MIYIKEKVKTQACLMGFLFHTKVAYHLICLKFDLRSSGQVQGHW